MRVCRCVHAADWRIQAGHRCIHPGLPNAALQTLPRPLELATVPATELARSIAVAGRPWIGFRHGQRREPSSRRSISWTGEPRGTAFQARRTFEPGRRRPRPGRETGDSWLACDPNHAPGTCPAASPVPSDGDSDGSPAPLGAVPRRFSDASGPTVPSRNVVFRGTTRVGSGDAAGLCPHLGKALTRSDCAPTFRSGNSNR